MSDEAADRPLNWNSCRLTAGWQEGVKAFYYGRGLTDPDFARPQVGIGTPLLDGNICNQHAPQLAAAIAEGCRAAGLLGFPFGTPAISDNITQGHEGGNASLPSRNMIASAADAVVGGHCYDALVGLHCCDKNGPGFAMALARLNFPGLIVSGGSIKPGNCRGKAVTILDVYDSQAAAAVDPSKREEADEILRTACPGVGGCGIAASFNTWGIISEAIGLALPNTSSIPAEDDAKTTECHDVGAAVRRLLELDLRPRDILTRKAFENGAAALAAAGGSTNGVLHLLALAREAGVAFTLADIQPIFRRTPVMANFAPRGRGTMFDLHNLGGTSVLLRHLLKAGLLHDDIMTVTGKTLGESLADVADVAVDQDLIAPIGQPFKETADVQICFGNVAPDGMVFKVSSLKDAAFTGTARCFNDTKAIADAAAAGQIKAGDIVVLREMGPLACGMPEVLVASAALSTPELYGKVALLSDTRVSGVSHGAIGVHVSPEAVAGGPIGLVRDGDQIRFDTLAGTVDWQVDDAEIKRRRAEHTVTMPHAGGYLAEFRAATSQASDGCVSKFQLATHENTPAEPAGVA